ncbi:low temperature requirement protein A [Lentilactobacillus kisonensis]|uniref:low temperature requirement protein A n=1 Tax=Lentilactobacillus kisonensis TaxID=481722 RepID=UPI001FB3F830|nr:low temperature requirement protein A [Lentilactobacillus kisonensis]
MMLNKLGKPRKITQIIHNRKISWLELFYDLTFTIIIGRLTEGLVEDFSKMTIINSIVIFGWFFWSWHETSGYFDNHGNDSALNIGIINVQIIFTAVAALFIPEGLAGHYHNLIWAMLPIEMMLIFVWYTISHFDTAHGPASKIWASVYGVALLILVIGTLIPSRFQFWVMLGVLVMNFGVVFVAQNALKREYRRTGLPYVVKDSLIERYGLMTMIALGEIIASLYAVTNHARLGELVKFILGIILTALIAAVYYQVIGELHIKLRSPVQTMAVRWLFLIEIYFVLLDGVLLQLVLTSEVLSVKVTFIMVLFVSLLLMWVIQQLTIAEDSFKSPRGIGFFYNRTDYLPGNRTVSKYLDDGSH